MQYESKLEPINENFNEIILHCSATAEKQNFDINDIDSWHKEQGWDKVGYHYVIKLDGAIQKGRKLVEIGAHCKDSGKNYTSIGICYIGGCAKDGKTPKDTRTKEQKVAIDLLIKNLVEAYPQFKKLSGHNKYAKKACPSFDVAVVYKSLAQELNLEL